MVSDPVTCQGRAHAGGSIQLHGDGGNAAEQEMTQWGRVRTDYFTEFKQKKASLSIS